MEVDHSPYRDMNDQHHDNDIFGSDEPIATERPKPDFSAEREKIEAEKKIATKLVKGLRISADLKEELADFMVDYYDLTPDNAPEILEQASTDLQEGMHIYLIDQGLDVAQDGTVDTTTERNKTALTNTTTESGLEKYLELVSLNKKIQTRKSFKPTKYVSTDSTVLFEVDSDGKLNDEENHHIPLSGEDIFDKLVDKNNIIKSETDAEREEKNGILLFQALDQYKLSSEVEEALVAEALEKIKRNHTTLTTENTPTVLLSVADKLKIEISVGLMKHDFSLDTTGRLTLSESKKSILDDVTIAWNLQLLEAAYKITNPGKDMEVIIIPTKTESGLTNTSEAETKPEIAAVPDKTRVIPKVKLDQELLQLNFSQAAIEASQDPLILEAMSTSSVGVEKTNQRGLAGFEQIIGRAISALEKKGGFTLGPNQEPILAGNLLQKTLLFWNKADRIKTAKNSPEYKRLVALVALQTETQEKIIALSQAKVRTGTEKISTQAPLPEAKKSPKTSNVRPSLGKIALASGAASIMSGDASYTNQDTAEEDGYEESTLVLPKVTNQLKTQDSNPASPRFAEVESRQSKPTLIETPTLPDLPLAVARANDLESSRERATVAEVAPKNAKNKVDARFANTTFKKPNSLGRRKAPNPDFKIDPFTYQSTDPNTAPKLERPKDLYPIDEAPDLDNPLPANKRIARKGEPVFEPGVVYKDNRLPRTEQRPETPVAMPDLRLPKQNKPELSLDEKIKIANKKVQEALREVNKSPQPEIRFTDSEVFNKLFFVSNDIYFKVRQLADLEIDKSQIEAGETTINPVLLASHEQKLQTELAQLWVTFEKNKKRAIKMGEKDLVDLQTQLNNASGKDATKTLTNQLATLRGKIDDLKELAQHSKESFFQKIKEERARTHADAQAKIKKAKREEQEAALKKQQQAEEDERLQKAEEETRRLRKLEPYPTLKPVKKKSNPPGQDLPTKRAA